jgi:hypothetical protein
VSRCRACDAPIIWAERPSGEGGGLLALDQHEQIGGDFTLDGRKASRAEPSDRKTGFREHECAAVVRRGVAG